MANPLPAIQAAVTGTIVALDDAELCHTLADFHGVQGRMVVGIALRQYLDTMVLTPTEVIHNAKLLKALLDQGRMVENASAKVAIAQARMPGQEQSARRAAIQGAIDETAAKARAAQVAFAALPKNRPPLDTVLSCPAGKTPTGDAEYDLRVALSLDLAEHRTWSAKLDRLIHFYDSERGERLAAAVDGVIGDILASVAATQELFGAPLLPGAALLKLCDLLFGRVSMDPMGPNRAGTLNGWFRQGRLPMARAMVLERIRRQLRAPQPLGRGQAEHEAEILRALMGHLLTRSGLIGGGPMADALTVRYSRRLEQGGASAYRRSIVGLSETQADLVCRIHYLAEVSTVPAAERHLGEIVDALDAALGNELLVENMILQTPDTALVRDGLTSAVAALRASGLPGEAKARIAGRAEMIVDEFAKRGRLGRRLHQIEPVLHRRTIRLAELACSGLVHEDGALPVMRQHITEIVRQPQFQAELVAQQNNEIAQAEIRRLYELLGKLHQTASAAPASPAPAVPPAPQPATVMVAPMKAPMAAASATTATTAQTVAIDLSTRVVEASFAAAPCRPLAVRGGDDDLCPACFAGKRGDGACRGCGYPDQFENRNGVHLMPGTLLMDRYRVGRILGQGGFGTTYLGWDERLRVKVAIKEFYPANLISRVPGSLGVMPFSDEHARGFEAGLRKFLDEARLLARLRDVKEIVSVQDFFEENATAYLVMELLEGRTMKKYVTESGGRIDARRTLAILSPIMKALQSVHEQGLIHRDISPDNIFLTIGGERKLLDFGAARHAARQAASMTVILKPGYAPPEQYSQDGKQGPWTDVYATCATAYCALTGKTPPDATSRFMNDKVPMPSELGATVPPAFERVLLTGLSMRWQDRPQSMRDLQRALSGTLGAG